MLITGCSFKSVLDSNYYCKKFNIDCTRNYKRVVFKTSKGNFEVKLFGEKKPVTVGNFIQNVKKNIYKNKRFYKIINYPQVQLIHSGIYPKDIYYKKENQNLNKFRRNIPLELKLKSETVPRYGYQIVDPSEIVKLTDLFEKGSLAMVKIGERNSLGSI